jgi:3'-phosphoadenosine 5'-phosphosulfate sulfotransferase (PAPS reductase)/FAD synthetase
MSIYRITHTPAEIAFSGGRTSGYMLYHLLKAHRYKLPKDVVVAFENTGEEAEETYEFVAEVARRWEVPIVWLEYSDTFTIEDYRNRKGKLSINRQRRSFGKGFRVVDFNTACRKGEPFDEMLAYYAQYRQQIKKIGPILPTRVTRRCTSNLKIKTVDLYMRKELGYEDYDAYLGIRYDEPKRWSKMMAANETRNDHYSRCFPMVRAKVTREDVLAFWKTQPFDLALDSLAEEGNCRLCFLKKTDRITRILRKYLRLNNNEPNAEIKRWLRRENSTDMTFRVDRPRISELVQIAISQEPIKGSPDEEEIDCICGSPSV